LKLLSIGLKNFGRFRKEHLFPINTTKEKNVILIKAENDRGKTTLFKAILYALYGSTPRIQISNWINLYEAELGTGETSVELVFEHDDGTEYRIVRTHKFLQTPAGQEIILDRQDSEISIYENNKPKKFQDDLARQDWIGKFFPKNASQFWFF